MFFKLPFIWSSKAFCFRDVTKNRELGIANSGKKVS